MENSIKPPESSKDLVNFQDTVWIKIFDKWKPQTSAKNCNKGQLWSLLTLEKESTFHFLERKQGTKKGYFMFNFQSQEWKEIDPP